MLSGVWHRFFHFVLSGRLRWRPLSFIMPRRALGASQAHSNAAFTSVDEIKNIRGGLQPFQTMAHFDFGSGPLR
jgi:hypothetical protein